MESEIKPFIKVGQARLEQKSLPSKEVGGVAEAEEEVPNEVKEIQAEAKETGAKVKETKAMEEVLGQQGPPLVIQDTRLSVMLICLLLKRVFATGPSGSPHISVLSPPPAPGRTTTSPKPTTETLTSSCTEISSTKLIIYSKIFIPQIYQKLTRLKLNK